MKKDNGKQRQILNAIKRMVWMARRYSDGKNTAAPEIFNRAYGVLRNEFGEEDIDDLANEREKQICKNFPYAREGELRENILFKS